MSAPTSESGTGSTLTASAASSSSGLLLTAASQPGESRGMAGRRMGLSGQEDLVWFVCWGTAFPHVCQPASSPCGVSLCPLRSQPLPSAPCGASLSIASLHPWRGQPLPLAEPASALCSLRGQPRHRQSSPLAGPATAWPVATPCGASLLPLRVLSASTPCGASLCPLRSQPLPSAPCGVSLGIASLRLHPLWGQPRRGRLPPLARPAFFPCGFHQPLPLAGSMVGHTIYNTAPLRVLGLLWVHPWHDVIE